jgi:alpha-L-rhamnosidase
VFDFGQNIVGWPELRLRGPVPAGTTVRIAPAESLAANGTVDQASLMGGGAGRGTNLFNTYTTAGLSGGETWRPSFNYFGMQWIQLTGLPDGYVPTADTVTGFRLQATTPVAGEFTSSNARINRIHTMARYSFAGNVMSVFTDCPGREKLSYPADYTMPMGAIHRNHELGAYLRTTMHHLVEGQSIADTSMFGNVALKTPVYDWGYTGRFGDEINWGNAIILVPALLYDLYGDTRTMARYYDRMIDFADYIQRQKAGTGPDAHIVDAALADWVAADQTSGRITGTWGYYTMISKLAVMARLTGHTADAEKYTTLTADIKAAFNAHFYNSTLRRYTTDGNAGTTGVTQTAQALALDAGLVPDGERQAVLDALVELVYAFHPNGTGPHFSGGTIGMAPTVRALAAAGRDDVLWDLLQEDDEPSYGFFMAPTTANPNGMTTMGERWNRRDSKNHMILAQIEEWFHSGLAGIRAATGAIAYRSLVIQPKLVGDLTHVKGSYRTPHGTVRSEWTRTDRRFSLTVTVPSNTDAEIWVPVPDGHGVQAPRRAQFLRVDGTYAVYRVASGTYTFTTVPR